MLPEAVLQRVAEGRRSAPQAEAPVMDDQEASSFARQRKPPGPMPA